MSMLQLLFYIDIIGNICQICNASFALTNAADALLACAADAACCTCSLQNKHAMLPDVIEKK